MKNIFTILLTLIFCGITTVYAQDESEASLLLDLKKTRAEYEVLKQRFDNDSRLYDEKALSLSELTTTRNELLAKEVDYQKLILRLIAQQSYLTIEDAVKYQNREEKRMVRVTLKSAMEGNEEYLNQFQEHFDIFTPEMRSGKIYNIYVSLVDNESKTIVGSPYEYRIDAIPLGESATVHFELLKDVENLTVVLNYNNRKDEKNIYLKKDASMNLIDITSMQFSQETNLNSSATYDLSLERFSTTDDVYRLHVVNLPRQISYEFVDGSSKVSQIRFAQGVNTKTISLRIYLPDREDEQIQTDVPISFFAIAIKNDDYAKFASLTSEELITENIHEFAAGLETLEIIPKGKGKIDVLVNSLYYEIYSDQSLSTSVTIRNSGSRTLHNIRLNVTTPQNWEVRIEPDLIPALDMDQEQKIDVTIIPSSETLVGAQEVKIGAHALSDNLRVDSEDKILRVKINARKSIGGTVLLVGILVLVISAVVIFAFKLSKK